MNQDLAGDFRSFLKSELDRRCKKNPFYSLRAFARQLGVSHTSLSQIMAGKRPLTLKAQKQMAESLGITPKQMIKFKMPAELKFEERFEKMDLDKFEALSDWYHDAILELTRLKIFKPDTKWIAKVLEVNVNQINMAVERLVKFGLLKIEEDGTWTDTSVHNSINFDENHTTNALKKYQKDILQKSQDALENLPRDKRDHTSLMLNFSSANLKKAKEIIKKFRTEFSTNMQTSKADNVFVLNIGFFPVIRSDK